MQRVSDRYKREMVKPTRGQSRIKVVFSMVDVEAVEDATVSDNGHEPLSNSSGTLFYNQENSYATAERKGFRLDGKQKVVPDDFKNLLYQGFVSPISDRNGYFNNNPVIDMEFKNPHSIKNLTITFDPVMDRHPSEIEVTAYRKKESVYQRTYDVDGSKYVVDGEFDEVDKIQIQVLRWSIPGQRARISNIMLGSDVTFGNDEVMSAKLTEDVDPITRRLSVNDFSFTVLNFDKLYNIDNQKGIWRYISMMSPIKAAFGLDVQHAWKDLKDKGVTWGRLKENGVTWGEMRNMYETEWLDFKHYVLTSMPSVDGNAVTFTCTDLLGTLTSTFFDTATKPSSRSMYDLAVMVFNDAGLHPYQYRIHDSLRTIHTNAIFPEAAHRDCLKVVAQASLCILYTDRDGVIRLEPNSRDECDFHVGFDDLYDLPKVEKSPQLMEIEGKWYQYAFNSEKGEAVKTEFTEVWKFGDTGEVEQINNPLITSKEHLEKVVDWYENYLYMRNTYYLNYRGNPELECNDRILIDTEFYEYVKSVTLKHEIDFNGGIRGSLIMKRFETRTPKLKALPFKLGGDEFS